MDDEADYFFEDGQYPTDDTCSECRADWKHPHRPECSQFHSCEFPAGCNNGALPGKRLCSPHFTAVSALFAPKVPA